jgi:uncharacterized protein YabE (DUF348 family)
MIKKNPCIAMPRSSAVFVVPIIFAVALLLLGVVQSNAETVTVTSQGDVEPVVSETKTESQLYQRCNIGLRFEEL